MKRCPGVLRISFIFAVFLSVVAISSLMQGCRRSSSHWEAVEIVESVVSPDATGSTERKIELLTRALRLDSTYSTAYALRATLLRSLGIKAREQNDQMASQKYLERAASDLVNAIKFEGEPDSVENRIHIALVLIELGKLGEAKEYLVQAEARNPTVEELERIRSLLNLPQMKGEPYQEHVPGTLPPPSSLFSL